MKATAYENCLLPLLNELGWHGNQKTLEDARPHFSKITTISSYCDVMDHLRYDSDRITVDMYNFDERLLPCLLVTKDDDIIVLISIKNNEITVHDGITNRRIILKLEKFHQLCQKGIFYIFKEKESDQAGDVNRGWFFSTLKKNKGLFINAILLSFILNILILSTPVFVMFVYDKVIGTSSYTMLSEFSGGIGLALLGIFIIYRIRSEHLSLIGSKFNKIIGDRILSQLLYLAPHYTEMATAGSQVARIKDFDRVREFFSGSYISVFFELPFILLSIVLIAILGGSLIIIPLVMLLIYIILGVIFSTKIQSLINKNSTIVSNMQEFLLESIEKIRVIKCNASIDKWSERYRDFSAKSSLTGIKLSVLDSINMSISDVIMIGSGMLMLAFGALSVMKEELTVGAMLAIMMIVWRILAPIKSIFNTLPRIVQLGNSIKQINRLMTIKPETEQMTRVKQGRIKFQGDISLQRVSIRYPMAYNPSLLGVNFSIKSGSLVAILGANGSGKSTILKLILGLYQPQAGAVLIDDRDIRQLNPLDLRNSIAYLPETPELFYGTIAENLCFGNASVAEQKMEEAAKQAGILNQIRSFPKGFDTLITDQSEHSLPNSFKNLLCLARAYLRDSSILLLDEPGSGFGELEEKKFMENLASLKGNKTIILATHKASHLKYVDNVILMSQGQVLVQGSPDEVIGKVPKEFL